MQESDWKTFRKLIPELRERYLASRNREIAALLAAPGKTETERFWKAEEEIRRQERILRDCLDDTRRSRLFESLLVMRIWSISAPKRRSACGRWIERARDVLIFPNFAFFATVA
jgi:hypothetical protein